ncbi:cupin domain-containing protein [Mycobacterium sp. NAZ190054]|uniref:cupin domain-containing protein n=1 Tax=Mycobacterium sp. NAZ190054 TaxID=1747766 RepID=UPI000AAC64CA|nr:cupin domain-containing protein [Mycobacterium sp. NAZ190054]
MRVPGERLPLDIQAASEATNLKLGTEIRRIRLQRGLTLVDIATETGLSASMLSMLERGKTGVSVGSLVAVASALGVAVSDLFHPSKAPEPSLVRFDEQHAVTVGPGVTRRVIQRSRTNGVEVASLRLAPGAHTGVELVRHEGYEIVVVQHGRLTVQIGGVENELEAGDAISLDAGSPHRFANNGDAVSEVLLVVRLSAVAKYGH